MIPNEYAKIAKPLVEARGLGESEQLKNTLLRELHFSSVIDVDNFGMLGKYIKPVKSEIKQFKIDLEWFRKYLECMSACWLEVFYFAPLDSIDAQISEDITVGGKFASSQAKRYLSVIICPDQSAFAARLTQIKSASKANVVICEGPNDQTAIAK